MPVSDEHTISAAILGQSIGSNEVVVSARMTMAYAAGIGAANEIYFDQAPMAPPAFVVSLEWRLLNGEAYRKLLGASQPVMERAVHLGQASRFFHPIRAGTKVVTKGRIEGLRQARRGVIVAVGLETTDMTGRILAASTFVALVLDSKLDGALQGTIDVDEPAARTRVEKTHVLTIPAATAHVYTECSGIWNPIHTEPAAARRAGFDVPIVHGTWTWASAMEWAIYQWCGGDPTLLQSWIGRFSAPVVPRTTIEFAGDYADHAIRVSARQGGAECFVASGMVGPS